MSILWSRRTTQIMQPFWGFTLEFNILSRRLSKSDTNIDNCLLDKLQISRMNRARKNHSKILTFHSAKCCFFFQKFYKTHWTEHRLIMFFTVFEEELKSCFVFKKTNFYNCSWRYSNLETETPLSFIHHHFLNNKSTDKQIT